MKLSATQIPAKQRKILNTTVASAAIVAIMEEILAFEVHLNGPKFRGIDVNTTVCGTCGGGNISEDRKDWISTADVLRRLDILKGLLREVNSL